MTDFLACVRSAVENGKVKQEKYNEAEASYNVKYEAGLEAGMDPSAARQAATDEAVKSITKASADKRWAKLAELRTAKELADGVTEIKGIKDVKHFLNGITRRVDARRDSVYGFAMREANKFIQASTPKFVGLVHPVAHFADVIRAAYGDVVSQSGKDLYGGIQDAMEFLRLHLNSLGASIRENPNHRLPQQHDRMKMLGISRDPETRRNTWIRDHLEHADLDLMEYKGEAMSGLTKAVQAEAFSKVFDNIFTNDNSMRQSSLATRLSHERFIYYKSADSYMAMMEKYGSGNLQTQVLGAMAAMSHDAALMSQFGPNVEGQAKYLRDMVKSKVGEFQLANTGTRDMLTQGEKALTKWDDQMKLLQGQVPAGKLDPGVQAFSTAREVIGTGLLAASGLKMMALDVPMMMGNARLYNLNAMRLLGGYIKALGDELSPSSSAFRERMATSGVVMHSAISNAHAASQFFGSSMAPEMIKRMSDTVYRAGWITAHDQAMKVAVQHEFMAELARQSSKSFDETAFGPLLQHYDVSPAEWDHFRAGTQLDEGGGKFLRPTDVYNEGDSALGRSAALKIQDMIVGSGLVMTNRSDTVVRAALGHAVPPTSLVGQMVRTIGMLKSFPTALWMMSGREILNRGTTKDKLGNLAAYAAWMLGGGVMYTQISNLQRGQDMARMDNRDFWLESWLRGGIMGLSGDVLFGGAGQSKGDGIGKELLGPSVEEAQKLQDLTVGSLTNLIKGKETHAGKEAVGLLSDLAPTPWYTKLALDRMIRDNLIKETDPQAYARMQDAQQAKGDSYWWGTGMTPRAPGISVGQ